MSDPAASHVPFRWDLLMPGNLDTLLEGAEPHSLWFLDHLVMTGCTGCRCRRTHGPRAGRGARDGGARPGPRRAQDLGGAMSKEPSIAEPWLRGLVIRLGAR